MDTVSEEKYPLLLLYVEEGGKRSEYPRRVVFADKTRGKNVIQGAATIITQWPAHVSSCWMTALIIVSIITFLTMLLMFASYNPLFIYNSSGLRCKRDAISPHNNRTIHIVHDSKEWTERQLQILKYIVSVYQNYQIHILTFQSNEVKPKMIKDEKTMNEKIKIVVNTEKIIETTTEKKMNKTESDTELFFINPFRSLDLSILEKIKRDIKQSVKRYARSVTEEKINLTYKSILNDHPNIKLESTTYKAYFKNTALQYYWMNLDKQMLIFASRVQELWQHGGLSFHIPSDNKKLNGTTKKSKHNSKGDGRLKNVILNSRALYENLTDDLVTVDGRGLHMGTKTACHSFFGEMVIKLIAQIDTISVPTLIQETLDAFCKRGAVNSDYCKALQNQL